VSEWDFGRLLSLSEELSLAAEDLVTLVDPLEADEVDLQAVDRCVRRVQHAWQTIKTLLNRERRSRA
jgi:hypothetical protein